jgi:hypothetical protein
VRWIAANFPFLNGYQEFGKRKNDFVHFMVAASEPQFRQEELESLKS